MPHPVAGWWMRVARLVMCVAPCYTSPVGGAQASLFGSESCPSFFGFADDPLPLPLPTLWDPGARHLPRREGLDSRPCLRTEFGGVYPPYGSDTPSHRRSALCSCWTRLYSDAVAPSLCGLVSPFSGRHRTASLAGPADGEPETFVSSGEESVARVLPRALPSGWLSWHT